MKIWFEITYNYTFDEDASSVWLGMGGYKHHTNHKWKGWTFFICLFKYMIHLNYVSNWKEYDKRINKTWTK